MVRSRAAAAVLTTALIASTAWAGTATVSLDCTGSTAVPGGLATIAVALAGDDVAGTQNDFAFDGDVFLVEPADCVINPAIGPDTAADKTLATSIVPSSGDLRNIVVALDNTNVIPSGPLYSCTFEVAADAALGSYVFEMLNQRASDPAGEVLPSQGTDCTISVVEATPTPTAECTDDEDCPPGQVCVDNECVVATPTPTPIGFCTDDEDCPPGQVCVDNRCVTPTPSPTPIGFCTDDEDCPPGQVCVDNMCVAVTPTVRSGGGGGGCSCEIDPGAAAGRSADWLAVLLPAVILLLRRRWRRRGL